MSGRNLPTNIIIDRLLHASDSTDALSSLQSLSKNIKSDDIEFSSLAVDILTKSNECLHALSTLIIQSSLPSGISLDEDDLGQITALETLESLANHKTFTQAIANKVFLTPIENSSNTSASSPLLHSLLDCLSNNTNSQSPYPRILSLQIISKVHSLSPTLTQENILSAPEGFHRLLSLLHTHPNSTNDESASLSQPQSESIRNETLLLLTHLAKSSTIIRKLLLFSEGYERVLGIAVSPDVEKTVVLDCLSICQHLLVEDGNNSCDLFFGAGGRSQVVVGGCVRLLDARFFKEARTMDLTTPITKNDDLDALLQSSPSSKGRQHGDEFPVPKMTKDEEEICHSVLNLFLFAIEVGEAGVINNKKKGDSVSDKLLSNQAVMGAILSLALYSPDMETQTPYYASTPTSSVQCHALDTLSQIISSSYTPNNPEKNKTSLGQIYALYEFYAGEASQSSLDRLIALCYKECISSLISSHARSALRHILSLEQTNLLILHALAPPPPTDLSEQKDERDPIIKNMIDTLSSEKSPPSTKQCIFLTLGILIMNGGDTARELFLRFMIKNSPFLDFLLLTLETEDNVFDHNFIINLLCVWSLDPPSCTMEKMLTSSQTLFIPKIFNEKKNPLAGMLLGLWLDYLKECTKNIDSSSSKKIEIGGWSAHTIMQVIQSFGISKYTTMLESLTKEDLNKSKNVKGLSQSFLFKNNSNTISLQEQKELQVMHLEMSNKIRKALVFMLTNTTNSTSLSLSPSSTTKEESEMSQLLSQYQAKISSIESRYDESQETIAKQASEIKNLKLKFQPATPLDEALAKQVDLTASLEQRVSELEKALKDQTELASNLEKKREQLETDVENEMKERMDREGELTALSSAYTTLESEFRKMKLSMENDATTDVSQENDLKSLQNEVIALQEQVRAGDEWMTMAVGRMNDMAAENADLQEQIDAKINNQTEIEDDMIVNIRREHETENNKLKKESEALSTELERAKKDNEEIRNDHSRQIQHMREEMISLEQELDIEREKNKEQNDAPSYSIDTGTVQTLERKVEQLLKEVEEKETLMTERNKTAEASLDALRKECDSIKLEKEQEIEKLNNELSTCSNIRDEIGKKNDTIKSLQEEVNVLKSKDSVNSEGGGNVNAHNFFSELPSNGTSLVSSMTKEEEDDLRMELLQLQQANDEAQEWMSNSYAHQESLLRDIGQLREENESLRKEIETLGQSSTSDENNLVKNEESSLKMENEDLCRRIIELETKLTESNEHSRHIEESQSLELVNEESKVLKKELEMRALEVKRVSTQLADAQNEVETLKKTLEEMKSSSETSKNNAIALRETDEEISELKHELLKAQTKVENSSKEIVSLTEQINVLQAQNKLKEHDHTVQQTSIQELENTKNTCSDLQNTIDKMEEENKNLLSEQENYIEAMGTLKSRLSEYQDWTKTAQDRISDLEEEKEVTEKKCNDLSQSEKILREKINELSAKVDLLQNKLNDAETNIASVSQKHTAEITEIKEKLNHSDSERVAISERLQVIETEKQAIIDGNDTLCHELRKIGRELFETDEGFDNVPQEKIVALLKQNISDIINFSGQTEQKLYSAEKNIESLQEMHKNRESNWKDEENELKTTVVNLQSQLRECNEDANLAISKWEESCSTLTMQLEEQKQELTDAYQLAQNAENLTALESKCADMEDVINELKEELVEKEEALALSEDEAAGYLERLTEDREKTEDALDQWKSTVDDLESTINELQQQLVNQNQIIEDQTAEAQNAIAHWEDRCASLEEQLDEQEKHLDEVDERAATQDEEIIELKQTESMLRSMLEAAKSQIVKLTKDMEYSNAKSEEERRALIEVIDSKVEKSMSLEMELDGAQASRVDIINKLKEYRNLLALEQQARVSTEESLRAEKNLSSQLETSLKSEAKTKNQLESDINKYKEDLKSMKEKILKSNQSQKASQEKLKKAESVATNLRLQVGELQGELQNVTGALSLQNTDNVATEATELATHALRAQVAEYQQAQIEDQKLYTEERDARVQVERELKRLKADLAILIRAEEYSGKANSIDGHLRKLASKASEEIFRRERQELENLRISLENVTDELRSSKLAEKNSEEKAASLRMHASMYEQEVSSLKNDVSFLNKTIEELRESGCNNIQTLQNRIEELEVDRETLVHNHAAVLERLKYEISQLNIEKDRLFHSLLESENTNAALVITETMNKDHCNEENVNGAELMRLKIANEELLAAAAESGSKTERRIREAVAASAASFEAELLFEKDLRETAEKSNEDLQHKIDEMEKRIANDVQKPEETETVIEVQKEIKKSNEELKDLKEKNSSLLLKQKEFEAKNKTLEGDLIKAQSAMTLLKKEYEHLKVQSREADRGALFEASVVSEIVRLRTTSSQSLDEMNGHHDHQGALTIRTNDESNKNALNSPNLTADEMYDHVYKLKETVQKERVMYQNLLEDHEELLAALAQQDLEIDSLRSGLEKFGGEEAVEEALRLVESKIENNLEEYAYS